MASLLSVPQARKVSTISSLMMSWGMTNVVDNDVDVDIDIED